MKNSPDSAEEDKVKRVLRGACFSLPGDSFTVGERTRAKRTYGGIAAASGAVPDWIFGLYSL
jgi:hypothetical protein